MSFLFFEDLIYFLGTYFVAGLQLASLELKNWNLFLYWHRIRTHSGLAQNTPTVLLLAVLCCCALDCRCAVGWCFASDCRCALECCSSLPLYTGGRTLVIFLVSPSEFLSSSWTSPISSPSTGMTGFISRVTYQPCLS